MDGLVSRSMDRYLSQGRQDIRSPAATGMIPGELFAREWFRPYEPGELAVVLAELSRKTDAEQGPS